MACIGFLLFFGLSYVLFTCEGRIISPAEGTKFTFLPGSTGNVTWTFDDKISTLDTRCWYFIPSGGSSEQLARIFDDDNPEIRQSNLSGVEIVKPATLLLKNVNQSYNGIYQFSLNGRYLVYPVGVKVSIARMPIATLNCSSPITLNEGDNVICECRGEGGNPPAEVTWYKDGQKIGGTATESKTLSLSNVDRTASGSYKCVAESYTLMDERSMEIIVYYAVPPTVTSFTSIPEHILYGESVVMTCEAIAVPVPSYAIIHNNTEIVSSQKSYNITVLEQKHIGSYECIVTNHLGNSSKTFSLSLAGNYNFLKTVVTNETRSTNSPATKPIRTGKASFEERSCTGETNWYMVIVSSMSGIVIGILLSHMISCSRRKLRSRNTQSNSKPTEADPTYQELDLRKMNTEDHYQSLTRNATNDDTGNDDDSTYTKLNQTRDVENNYQSLTWNVVIY